MTSMQTAERTIEDILSMRVRAAELRVRACELAVATKLDPAVAAEMEEAKQLADEDLELARREIECLRGADVEAVDFDPAGLSTLRRYAAVLMEENPELTLEEALTEAARDEQARSDHWSERYLDESDDTPAVPATREELLAWVDAMPAIPRARLLRLLVDARVTVELAARRRAAVAEATQTQSAAEVADQLGVSVYAVYKATTEHNRAGARRGERRSAVRRGGEE